MSLHLLRVIRTLLGLDRPVVGESGDDSPDLLCDVEWVYVEESFLELAARGTSASGQTAIAGSQSAAET